MKNILKVVSIVSALIFPGQLLAETWYALQVNGLSWHSQDRAFDGTKLNEVNTGFGIQITQSVIDQPHNFVHWHLGGLKNSMGDTTGYAGGAITRRWGSLTGGLRFDAGLFLGILTYPSYERGFLMTPAPVMSFGTEQLSLNTIVVPSVADLPAFVFLQLRIGI